MSTGTLKKNRVVEWLFSTLYYLMRTMIMHTRLNENLKTIIWPGCAATAKKLETLW